MELRTESHDWFTSAHKEQTSKVYRFEDFTSQLEKQILRRIDCLHADFYCFNQHYFMKDLKIVLERQKFDDLCSSVNSKDEILYPILTFHATQNVTKINSIVKYGYILPNNEHPTFGWTLIMRTGNLYGDGVYSSPDFNTAEWFSFVDEKSAVQVIVNMVLIGKTKTVEAGKWYKAKKEKSLKGVIPSLNGDKYEDAEGVYHTLLSPDAKIYVTGDSKRIVPVALLTVSPNTGNGIMKAYFKVPPKTLKSLKYGPRVVSPQAAAYVELFHIHKDYYVLDLRPVIEDAALVTTKARVVNLFALPKKRDLLSNAVFVKGVNDFINSMVAASKGSSASSSSSVFLYANTTEKHTIGSVDAFQSLIASPTLKYVAADKYVEDLAAHLTALVEDVIRVNSNEHEHTVHVVYLFVSTPSDVEAVDKVCQEYKIFKKVLFKLIFLPSLDSTFATDKDQAKQKKVSQYCVK